MDLMVKLLVCIIALAGAGFGGAAIATKRAAPAPVTPAQVVEESRTPPAEIVGRWSGGRELGPRWLEATSYHVLRGTTRVGNGWSVGGWSDPIPYQHFRTVRTSAGALLSVDFLDERGAISETWVVKSPTEVVSLLATKEPEALHRED